MGTTGGLLREGLPLDEVAGGLARARADERALFELPDALGYNPVQLPRYWRYIRGHQRTLGLLQRVGAQHARPSRTSVCSGLRYLVVPTGWTLPSEADRRGRRRLLAMGARGPPAAGDLQRRRGEYADDIQHGLDLDRHARFDPSTVTIVERSSASSGALDLRPVAPTSRRRSPQIRIRIEPPGGGVLTIRNVLRGRLARGLDGRVAEHCRRWIPPRCRAPSSTREVILTYHDDAVMLGIALGPQSGRSFSPRHSSRFCSSVVLFLVALPRTPALARATRVSHGRPPPELAFDEPVDVAAEDA